MHAQDIFDINRYADTCDEDLAWLITRQEVHPLARRKMQAELARRAMHALGLTENDEGDVIPTTHTIDF